MDEPWQIYYEEIHHRAEEIVEHEMNVEADMREAALEAFESTVDRLVNQLDLQEDDARSLSREFAEALRDWTEEGHFDWNELADALDNRQAAWEDDAGF